MGCPISPFVATRRARRCMEEHFALAPISVMALIMRRVLGRSLLAQSSDLPRLGHFLFSFYLVVSAPEGG